MCPINVLLFECLIATDLPAIHWHQRNHVLCSSAIQHSWIWW